MTVIRWPTRWRIAGAGGQAAMTRWTTFAHSAWSAIDMNMEDAKRMTTENNASFDGWALVEMFGHSREAGYVTTVYFGPTAMFRVDVPEIPARRETIDRPRWIGDKLCPIGTVVEGEAIQGRTRYLGPGSIYAMNPATEEAVRAAVANGVQRTIKVISIPEGMALPAPSLPGEQDEFLDDGEAEEEPEF